MYVFGPTDPLWWVFTAGDSHTGLAGVNNRRLDIEYSYVCETPYVIVNSTTEFAGLRARKYGPASFFGSNALRNYVELSVPLWMLLAATLIYPSTVLVRGPLRRFRRRRAERCIQCGYRLRGLVEPVRCPECGLAVDDQPIP
jgi:hypothetical protein